MKLPRVTNGKLGMAMRLNWLVLVVTLLWLVTTVVFLLVSRPETAHAVQPRETAALQTRTISSSHDASRTARSAHSPAKDATKAEVSRF